MSPMSPLHTTPVQRRARRWRTRVVPILLAMAVAGSWVFPGGSNPVSAAVPQRVAGADRYATAVEVARQVGGGSLTGLDRLIVVTGETFPDGLTASGLAGYLDNGGRSGRTAILLTRTDSLPPVVELAIRDSRVAPASVFVVGGTAVVSEVVRDAVARSAGWNGQGDNPVTRIAGQDRYETAAAIVEFVNEQAGAGLPASYRTVLVANGVNFPDALAGGALAYRSGHLMVLSRPSDTPPVARDAIDELEANCAVLLGGPAALAAIVGTQVNAVLAPEGCGTDRLGGEDRFGTAASIANRMRSTNGSPSRVMLTSGTNFTDALVAAPLASGNTPILFTSPSGLPAATLNWLQANSATLTQVQVIGGTTAVPDVVVNAALAAVNGGSGGGGSGGGGSGGGGGGSGGGGGGSSPSSWLVKAGGVDNDAGYAIAALPDGSGAIVTGKFEGVVTFGDTTLDSGEDAGVFVAKVDASGDWDWALGTTGDGAQGNGVVTLADGSAIVVGNFFNNVTLSAANTVSGSAIVFDDGPNVLLNEIFVARVTPAGTWAWAIKAGGVGQDYGEGISVTPDESGVIITGSDSGNVYVARVATADGTIVWETTATSADATGNSVSVLADGNGAIVVGEYDSTLVFGGPIGSLTGVRGAVFVARINSAGAWQWASKVDGLEYDSGRGVSVLADGNGAIVTGSFDTSASFTPVTSGAITLTSGAAFDEDLYVAKINAAGEWVWALSAGGSGRDVGSAVVAQGDGSAIITGFTRSAPASFGNDELTSTGKVAFVAKISAAGAWDWASAAGGAGTSEGLGIAVLANGTIFVTGLFTGTVSFGTASLTSAGVLDVFVARISSTGVFG